jgi:hypothetical protein
MAAPDRSWNTSARGWSIARRFARRGVAGVAVSSSAVTFTNVYLVDINNAASNVTLNGTLTNPMIP